VNRWKHVIGIVGGLGPHAHLELEREILRAVGWAKGDQDYPEWVLASLPGTPDRTAALIAGGESPVPLLVESLRVLSQRADFAVIACITAHAFLAELEPQGVMPILDAVEETMLSAARLESRRVGVLATTGCLRSGLFSRARDRVCPEVEIFSLVDLPNGTTLQQKLVMEPIYGEPGVEDGPSLKRGAGADTRSGQRLAGQLRQAATALVEAGADAVVLGCTEIPLALGHVPVQGAPVVDPMRVAAEAAVQIALGERQLPAARRAIL